MWPPLFVKSSQTFLGTLPQRQGSPHHYQQPGGGEREEAALHQSSSFLPPQLRLALVADFLRFRQRCGRLVRAVAYRADGAVDRDVEGGARSDVVAAGTSNWARIAAASSRRPASYATAFTGL